MDIAPPTFGDLLRRHRLAAGLSQEALAERAGLSARGVSDLERGVHRAPRRESVALLTAALGLAATERAALAAAVQSGRAPPARPAPALPVALTSFVGRERELAEVRRRLGATRLLTLTGTGGVGKTRLALALAEAARADDTDGAWLVELAPLADPALVPLTVAGVLGVREQPGRLILTTLLAALGPTRLLLVLDNCEHLIDACARLADALLRGCPGLTILATSREALGIAGELAWRVPSLALPDPRRPPPLAELGQVEAIRLFVERAAFAEPRFALTDRNAPAVARLCRRLDGIPLAIELAAARVPALTVDQIAARLDDRFHLLTGGSRTALPRQRTLRATLDWSYALLTEPERALFRRLAVFAGGWTLEAAEAVGAGAGVAPAAVLDTLARLVGKSLVLAEAQGAAARYRLLETIRQYAGEKLLAAGQAATTRDRHRDWCLALAERAMPRLWTRDQLVWLERLEAEHDNLRAALDWSHGQPDGGAAELRLAGALGQFWHWRGHNAEGLARLTAALAHAGEAAPAAARALALFWAGLFQRASGRLDRAREQLAESRALARTAGDWRLAAQATRRLAMVAAASDDRAELRTLLEETLRLARQAGEPCMLTMALGQLAQTLRLEGEEEAVRLLLAEGLALSRASGERSSRCMIFSLMALQAIDGGEYGHARELIEEALAGARELGMAPILARNLATRGLIARLEADAPAARAHFREALATAERIGDREVLAWTAIELAGLSAIVGQPRRAARLWGAMAGWRASATVAMPVQDRGFAARWEHDLAAARAGLGEAAFAAAWAEGAALTLEEAVAEALAEEGGDG